MNEAKIKTINPATEEVLNEHKIMTKEQINDKVKKAKIAFQDWRKDTSKRPDLLHDFATQLRKIRRTLLGANHFHPFMRMQIFQ